MYDKVCFWIDRAMLNEVTTIEKIMERTRGTTIQTDIDSGEETITGNIGGLRLKANWGGVSVLGSLPKYFHGDNIYTLTRHSTKEAFEKLEEELGVCVMGCKVSSFEFGTTFVMKNKVEEYFKRLGDAQRLERCQFTASTIYYKQRKGNRRAFCFYDKSAEEKARGEELPRGLEDANLLRYEMRYKGNLKRQLMYDVKVETLFERDFYRDLLDKYKSFYSTITKYHKTNNEIMGDRKITTNEAFEILVARLINQCDKGIIDGFFEEIKKANALNDKKAFKRLKDKIKDIGAKVGTAKDELLEELDDEIKNVGIYD